MEDTSRLIVFAWTERHVNAPAMWVLLVDVITLVVPPRKPGDDFFVGELVGAEAHVLPAIQIAARLRMPPALAR